MNQRKSGDSFVKGAVLLGFTGIFVKIIGAFFRIPLGRLLGPGGMGYYSSAYPIYNFLLVLAAAGLPTAIAKIISEQRAIGNPKNIHKTFKMGMLLMVSVGFAGSLFMFFGADWLLRRANNPNAIYAFKAMAPAVLVVSVMAVFRGFFQGHQEMKPFAASQIFEQIGRVVIGYGSAVWLLPTGLAFAAGGATFGATAGALLGLAIISMWYFRFKSNHVYEAVTSETSEVLLSGQYIVKRILWIAIPITLGAAVMPLMGIIDFMLVINRLTDIGYSSAAANEFYGMLSGYAASVVNFPQAITSAIQISIVPAVSLLFMRKSAEKMGKTIENSVRMTLLVALPSAVGLVLLAQPIIELLYPAQSAYAETTGNILSILGFGVIFLGMFQVTTGILQGMGLQNRPAINLLIGALIKMALTYVLVGIPTIHILGAPMSTLAAYATATALNLMTLKKRAHITFDVKSVFFKPLLASIGMGVGALVARKLLMMATLSGRLSTAIAILFGAVLYGALIFVTGTITEDDLAFMPGGSKLKRLAQKLRRDA